MNGDIYLTVLNVYITGFCSFWTMVPVVAAGLPVDIVLLRLFVIGLEELRLCLLVLLLLDLLLLILLIDFVGVFRLMLLLLLLLIFWSGLLLPFVEDRLIGKLLLRPIILGFGSVAFLLEFLFKRLLNRLNLLWCGALLLFRLIPPSSGPFFKFI